MTIVLDGRRIGEDDYARAKVELAIAGCLNPACEGLQCVSSALRLRCQFLLFHTVSSCEKLWIACRGQLAGGGPLQRHLCGHQQQGAGQSHHFEGAPGLEAATMSVSKTSKLLQYINYREYRCRRLCMMLTFLPATLLKTLAHKHTALQRRMRYATVGPPQWLSPMHAGMRVTITDGRQMVGR